MRKSHSEVRDDGPYKNLLQIVQPPKKKIAKLNLIWNYCWEKPKVLSNRAEEATMRAAKRVGTNTSREDLLAKWAGKHIFSPGMSSGILTYPSEWHVREKGEEREMADTNASSGENEATATVKMSTTVHTPAWYSKGRWVESWSWTDFNSDDRDILLAINVYQWED